MGVELNGVAVDNYNPHPSEAAKEHVAKTMRSIGAVIESSQWKGWAPMQHQCPGGGNLDISHFEIHNVRVKGTVVQGPEPTKCSETPTSMPVTTTQPVTTGCCSWDGSSCGDCGDDGNGWCHESSANCATCGGNLISKQPPQCPGSGSGGAYGDISCHMFTLLLSVQC